MAETTTAAPIYLEETWHKPQGRAIREVVFGANDGLVTTLGFIMGVYGAIQDTRIIIITTIAEAAAGAISMGAGGYLASQSQRRFFESEIERERREMDEMPAKEQEEIRRIYRTKGFEGQELEMVVRRITSNKEVWLRVMMEEELGLIQEQFERPLVAGVVVGLSFVAGAIAPLAPFFLVSGQTALLWSLVTGMTALFALGAGRTVLTKGAWWKNGLEVFVIGMVACVVGFGIGKLLGVINI